MRSRTCGAGLSRRGSRIPFDDQLYLTLVGSQMLRAIDPLGRGFLELVKNFKILCFSPRDVSQGALEPAFLPK